MKILCLRLIGFKPLALNYIESIELNFENPICLILGTNGCGKSSLLRELTPLPPTSSDYTELGEKYIKIEFNNSIYEFYSYTKKNKHTAIKDKIIIHDNLTLTNHRDYIIKEFNYTPLVHKVLTGELKFTTMTPSQRRELLTLISPLDLDYVLKFYNKVKEELRDTIGINKHLTQKKTSLLYNLNTIVLPENFETNKELLESQLNKLIPYINQKIKPSIDLYNDLDKKLIYFNALAKQCKLFKPIYIHKNDIKNINELTIYIGQCLGNKEQIQNQIFLIANELSCLTQLTDSIEANLTTIDDIKQYYNETQVKINQLVITSNNIDTKVCKLAIDKLETELLIIISHLSPNSFLDYSSINRILNIYVKLVNKITLLKNENNLLTDKYNHFLDNKNSISCPKCNFRFNHKGLDINETILKLELLLNKHKTSIIFYENRLNKILPTVEECNKIKQYANHFLQLKRQLGLPFEFWELITDEYDGIKKRYDLINHCSIWKQKLNKIDTYNELTKELLTYKEAIDFYYKNGYTISNQVALLTNKLNDLIKEKNNIEQLITYSKNLLKKINYYNDLNEQCNNSVKVIKLLFNDLQESLITEHAKKQSGVLYNELGNYNSILTNFNNLKTNLDQLVIEYDEILEKQQLLTILEEQLSPTKGLIAEQMLGFLYSYTEEINKIINTLWGYDLVVKNPNVDNGIIDYYFPLQIENEIIEDISKGSTGQKDVIDLAFILVMREYLNLTEYPLFMDEIGASFDHEHRSLLLDYIDKLISNRYIQQLFIVNHYALMYNKLSFFDTVILDERNIGIIPERYNEIIKINKK